MSQASATPYEPASVSLDDPDVALFIGPNAKRIVAKLRLYEVDRTTGRSPRGHFNIFIWPALILGVAWYLYRRMYVEALAIMAAFILIEVVLAILAIDLGGGLNTGFGLAVGIAAPLLYRRHVKRKVARIRRETADPQLREQRLRRGGGVDWISPCVLASVIIALIWWAYLA